MSSAKSFWDRLYENLFPGIAPPASSNEARITQRQIEQREAERKRRFEIQRKRDAEEALEWYRTQSRNAEWNPPSIFPSRRIRPSPAYPIPLQARNEFTEDKMKKTLEDFKTKTKIPQEKYDRLERRFTMGQHKRKRGEGV